MVDFIADLDEYFCETYANYDKLCVLDGYRMPKMQDSEVREDGRTYAYTLPANTMRLALQENKDALLQALKNRSVDKTFSFSFSPVGFFSRIKNTFSKYAPHKWLQSVLSKNAISASEAGDALAIDPDIWQKIVKGKYAPTKNTILSFALTSHISVGDTKNLLSVNGYEWDFTIEKDVVVCYLLKNKVFNREMIERAFAEYKISNLFLK